MGENVEITESVKVQDPVTGRIVTVFVKENEVNMLLSVGVNTLLAAGMITISPKDEEAPAETPVMQ